MARPRESSARRSTSFRDFATRSGCRPSWESARILFIDDPDYEGLNDALERVASDHGSTKTAVAINWVLRYPAKMQALVGTTRPERIRESASACDWEMSREEWYEIYLGAGHQLP